MSHDKWEELLVAEHEMIERAMAVLEQELDKLEVGAETSFRLRRSVDFLLQFGDAIHNVKEEVVLFPLMEQRGIPRQGGPIAVMLSEHEDERKLLAGTLDALPELSERSAEELEQLVADGKRYLEVRSEHIWKENDVLYVMGRKAFTEEDGAHLVQEFERLDLERYGPGAAGHFRAMLYEAEKGGRDKKLLENLSYAQIDAIMETLPVEVTFVDAEDMVAYFNRLDKEKIFTRTRSVIGRKVLKCHPGHSVDKVEQIVEGFKDGTLESADFWIDFKGDKILIRYFPVRDDAGSYLGVVEVTQSIGWIQKLEGQKRLLD